MLRYRSHAKINLILEVGELRGDGFHEVRTVMQTITLADELTFARASEQGGSDAGAISVTCDAPDVPGGEENLVHRAAVLLRDAVASGDIPFDESARGTNARARDANAAALGARVHIAKSVPAGAGLGGGSSNAACALVALATLWQLDAEKTALTQIAAKLGSDVPFFLFGGAALCAGRGERVFPRPSLAASHAFLLVTPDVHVSSVFAYNELDRFRLTSGMAAPKMVPPEEEMPRPDALVKRLYNRFDEVVLPAFPIIRDVQSRMAGHCSSPVTLSGSGSSLFGVLAQSNAERDFAGEFADCRLAQVVHPTDHGIVPIPPVAEDEPRG